MKIAVISDSGCGMSEKEAQERGIFILPLQLIINDISYRDGVDIQADDLYAKLKEGALPKTSMPVMSDIDTLFHQLKEEGYDAIFICSGAGLPKMLNVPGENLNGVYSANEFLTRVNLMHANDPNMPTPLKVGTRAAIIGGGNVAMDAARTAVRVGYKEVYIVYRRTEEELPARKEEIRHAKEEGIIFKLLHSPVEILGKDGCVNGIKLEVMELGEPDDSGRRRPVPTGKYDTMDVDAVIVSLGTGPNPIIQQSATKENINIETDKKGYIIINENGETSVKDIYAGGDVAPRGESTAINAMGAGKTAAKAIIEALCALKA